MTYSAWRISYQSSEAAARVLWHEIQQLKIDNDILRKQLDEWRDAARGNKSYAAHQRSES